MMASKNRRLYWKEFLAPISVGRTTLKYGAGHNIFLQGQPADSLFYVRSGRVKLSVRSLQNKEAIVAVLGAGEFVGEGCLAGQQVRVATATALKDCSLEKIEKSAMVRMLHERHGASELFVTHLLSRNVRYEKSLVDQLFNSSEKRLARVLLVLASYGSASRAETVLPGVNRESLAQVVGTTPSRVSHFMNKFRKLGLIDYNGGGLTVHGSLLNVVLQD